jgi:hypothetical protein
MDANRRFSLMPFPQFFDGRTLRLNIVVMPRDHNPLAPAIEGAPGIPDPGKAFADARLSFDARVVSGLADFPNTLSPGATLDAPTVAPAKARAVFEAIAASLQIDNFGTLNTNNVVEALGSRHKPPPPKSGLPVRKYLPLSYRGTFNFTTPRTKAAVTDDTYHCALRDATPVKPFTKTPESISWGKVFAYAMRQPKLAEQLGMIYQDVPVDLDGVDLTQGGWLFLDLKPASDFRPQMDAAPLTADGEFMRRYAARLPVLTEGTKRALFAPLLFPVLPKLNAGDPDPPPPSGNYGELFTEAADYDDGFARIVHAMQPKTRNFLSEDERGASPAGESGIRLGWDDEQILIWYLRQLALDPDVGAQIDAPLGVNGYAVDVRETGDADWVSLNAVASKNKLALAGVPGDFGKFEGDLPYQVYPSQLDGNNGTWWLPMYFANWTGGRIVLPDADGARIYLHDKLDRNRPYNTVYPADPSGPHSVIEPPKGDLSKVYEPLGEMVPLRYGNSYDFRVRMLDLSGGGPGPEAEPVREAPSSVHTVHFKRYVAPQQPRTDTKLFDKGVIENLDSLVLQRPLLGYPAVVYTAKYADPVSLLFEAAKNTTTDAFGIADPDVNRIEITVDVETLKLDYALSATGRENYVRLYQTTRTFPAVAVEDDYDDKLAISIVYRDVNVLHFGEGADPVADLLGPGTNIDDIDEIVLPTARRIRLTLRAVCADRPDEDKYYGVIDKGDPDADSRFGHIVEFLVYRASGDETGLFAFTSAPDRLRALLLRPGPPPVRDGRDDSVLLGQKPRDIPDIAKRLAAAIGVEANGLTLVAPKGERVQFGCSSRIRHTLSPDGSSITFASEGDLTGHWLSCVQLTIDRDWTWDGLGDLSFSFQRQARFTHDKAGETEDTLVGDIEVRRTASFEMLDGSQRDHTRLIFIDAVEPKNPRLRDAPHDGEPRFPDTIEVDYTVTTTFKPGHADDGRDVPETLSIRLPISTPPAQVPKIASAGIALSPYWRNDRYSETGQRRRVLWIEFAEPIADPDDTYFARLLAYAPDQLISNNHPDLLIAPEEPPLAIDPEFTNVIVPGASNDLSGLGDMQPMVKSLDSDTHYLLPLPPGTDANADEMFGFFTYEFRVGHYKRGNEMVWTTAQGRYGRRLRATGIQHPAPSLTCVPNRDEEKLWVVAPFATAVYAGRDVTAEPPRTQLWCLLYAQVRQADDKDTRNILLDDKQLDWRVEINREAGRNAAMRYDDDGLNVLREVALKNAKLELDIAKVANTLSLVDYANSSKEARKYGTAVWTNDEVAQWLELYALPPDAPLSVLVVEVLPQITRLSEHVSFGEFERRPANHDTVQARTLRIDQRWEALSHQPSPSQTGSPVSDELGNYRILRTSPLTEVPFVCCPA